MEAHCSFYTLVGGLCTYDRRDRKHTTEIVPLFTCAKDICSHKSLWGIHDVDNEVDLILARASIFECSENIHSFSICPFHRLTLGIGWKRSGTRCSVPQQLSGHNKRKLPKGDRGISKLLSDQVWKHTGILIPVGSGNIIN